MRLYLSIMNMMNKFIALLLCSCCFTGISARGIWTINSSQFNVDTLYTATVGPGTVETELRVSRYVAGADKIYNVFVTTVDLSNQYVEMRAAKAGNSMRALETVPQIAERYSTDEEVYFAGVNADFFSLDFPYHSLGANIMSGSLARRTLTGSAADIDDYFLSFDCAGVPSFSRHVKLGTYGTIKLSDGSTHQFLFNEIRNADYLVLYTRQWQRYDGYTLNDAGNTATNEYGTEIALVPVDKRSTMWGSEMILEAIEVPEVRVGSMNIPDGGYVLSGHGKAESFVAAIKKGDRVTVSADASLDDGSSIEVKELIGGFPFILCDNTVQPTLSYPAHLSNSEPRSAVGYNADKSKLYMIVVDGRNAGGSAGVTQKRLAEFCQQIGCSDAMNFDGGGSSTMFVEKLGVRNIPSGSSLDARPEGTPRAVVNALFAVAVAPYDTEVSSIEIREKRVELSAGETYTPTVYGYNKYGVLVNTDLRGFSIHVAPELGSIEGGDFIAGSGNYRGDFTVSYNGAYSSIPLFVNGINGEYVTSGTDEIVIDERLVAPEYYTVMGQRIDHPIKGSVIIEKRGGQVRKRLL